MLTYQGNFHSATAPGWNGSAKSLMVLGLSAIISTPRNRQAVTAWLKMLSMTTRSAPTSRMMSSRLW